MHLVVDAVYYVGGRVEVAVEHRELDALPPDRVLRHVVEAVEREPVARVEQRRLHLNSAHLARLLLPVHGDRGERAGRLPREHRHGLEARRAVDYARNGYVLLRREQAVHLLRNQYAHRNLEEPALPLLVGRYHRSVLVKVTVEKFLVAQAVNVGRVFAERNRVRFRFERAPELHVAQHVLDRHRLDARDAAALAYIRERREVAQYRLESLRHLVPFAPAVAEPAAVALPVVYRPVRHAELVLHVE